MMELCLNNRSTDDTKSLDQLLNFMHKSGIGFPGDNVSETDYSVPLRAMAELADKWAHPLWFHVNIVLPQNEATKRVITLSHSPVTEVWNDFQEALMVYEDVYPIYVHILATAIYKGSIEKSFLKFVAQTKFIQKHIFGNLSMIVGNKFHNPVWMKIKSLPSVVKNVSVEDWLKALRQLWIIDPPLSEEDTVYVEDGDLLVAMNTLFTAYTAKDIYLHIHWWFVQSIGAITSNAIFSFLLKDPERGPFFQKLICSMQVILNYNTILASEKRASLSATERAAIMAAVSNVHNMAVSKVSSAIGSKLALLLGKMQPVIWPRDPYAEEEHLLRLYGNQTNDVASNLFEIWLSRGIGYQQSRGFLDLRSAHAATFEVDSSSVGSHHAISGTVSLSLALLGAPFYYPDVTSAIIYGGMGFAYAHELVRTLNSLSLLLDGKDAITPSEAAPSHSYIWMPFSCSGMADAEVYPRHAALELAYSTYIKFRRDDEDVRLGNAKSYSPEQIFFATVCYLMCDMAIGASECDVSMRHFAPFEAAFSCSLGEEKCAVLS
ncbi:hypothetical protein V5799_017887 [Amblyomma americanum]|uniref:Uncharacterized protein n=1 Tax=Amblyomma americanum TaxID=6943 RepID=A0AAQ4F1F7_AMBAM